MNDLYNRSASVAESQQKLELFFSCRDLANMDYLSKSDPFIVFHVKRNNQWSEAGRTEIIQDNLNPNFTKSFIIDYYFECSQPLKFVVNDDDGDGKFDYIGQAETTLATIAGSRDQLVILPLSNGHKKTGTLIIRADQVRLINDKLVMLISAKDLPNTRFLPWHSTSPFLRFYRQRRDTGQLVLVHETEPRKSDRNPTWKRIDITAQKFCNGDYQMPIKIEVWDYRSSGDHEKIGDTEVNVEDLRSRVVQKRQFLDKHKKQVGHLIFNEFKLFEKPSFIDYLQSGTQINLIAAIDFTASNQNPTNPASLHYIDNTHNRLNQYQQALLSVGEILLNYDHDKKIPIFGFGCKPRLPNLSSPQTLHCFPLNGNAQDPEVFQMDGLMQAYNFAVRNVQFDGPTYFNPIIQESMKIAQLCQDMASNTYFVLLILTDGEIHDMQPTINSIVASSHLPLSIIIVGVGDADFTNMNILDDDDGNLHDQQGRRTQRDLVQFVPFNQFKNNPELLAKNVLQELPDQLVDYMVLVQKKPGPKTEINLSQLDVNTYAQNYSQQQFLQQQQPQPPQYQQPPPPLQYPQVQQIIQQNPPQQQQSQYPTQPQLPQQQYPQQPQQYPSQSQFPIQQQYQQPLPQQYPQQQIPQIYPQQQPQQGVNQAKLASGMVGANFLGQHINNAFDDAQQQQIQQQQQNQYSQQVTQQQVNQGYYQQQQPPYNPYGQ